MKTIEPMWVSGVVSTSFAMISNRLFFAHSPFDIFPNAEKNEFFLMSEATVIAAVFVFFLYNSTVMYIIMRPAQQER